MQADNTKRLTTKTSYCQVMSHMLLKSVHVMYSF